MRVLRPIADALDTAHDAGMIHRDFKPQNILIGSRDHAYLADFGLTQALGQPGLTRTGQFVGTLDYIAPEQIHGRPATRRSDVYAFGAVLFECLTGRVPYERESDAAILFAHVSEPPAAPERGPRRCAERGGRGARTRDGEGPRAAHGLGERGDRRAGGRDRPGHAPRRRRRPGAAPTGERPQVRSASTTVGHQIQTPAATGKTIIDRPPSASQVGPRPVIKRSYRKPILITLAVILVAAASSAGFLLSDRGPTEAQQAHTAYLAAVDKVVNTLAEQQQSGRETLAAADEQREQIEATGGLANTYEATGDDLDALKVPVADAARHKQLVALVDKAQSQYATMRQAAETNDKPTYDATTAEVVATENDLNKLIAALRGAPSQ